MAATCLIKKIEKIEIEVAPWQYDSTAIRLKETTLIVCNVIFSGY